MRYVESSGNDPQWLPGNMERVVFVGCCSMFKHQECGGSTKQPETHTKHLGRTQKLYTHISLQQNAPHLCCRAASLRKITKHRASLARICYLIRFAGKLHRSTVLNQSACHCCCRSPCRFVCILCALLWVLAVRTPTTNMWHHPQAICYYTIYMFALWSIFFPNRKVSSVCKQSVSNCVFHFTCLKRHAVAMMLCISWCYIVLHIGCWLKGFDSV